MTTTKEHAFWAVYYGRIPVRRLALTCLEPVLIAVGALGVRPLIAEVEGHEVAARLPAWFEVGLLAVAALYALSALFEVARAVTARVRLRSVDPAIKARFEDHLRQRDDFSRLVSDADEAMSAPLARTARRMDASRQRRTRGSQ